ncbi:Polyketide Synthase [Blumeria hordei DH14]|uniref:Polyketide Synthase n=1 Tax=Blumeria graminis f. sp. hordei (strain DH14) TaxID=546991 RepID=N1J930_BLUG1|nr:Polyketide Synthase [Blumeria hordei DH14]
MADTTFDEVNLSILGVAAEYPPFVHDSTVLQKMCERHYPKNAAMEKVCMINRYTGIETRSAIGPADYPLANMDRAPNISELCEVFRKDGVGMAVAASRKALAEAQITPAEITHIVATTCTNSANPGFDHQLMIDLGITHPVEKILLQGIGCSGGLAGLRTAANLALGHTFRGRPARILVVAAEICSLLIRSELDSIYELQETRIGVTLFSDCGSALVLSNGLGPQQAEPVYELLGWDHRVIPDSHRALRFDAHPNGWKVALSPEVPKLACEIVGPSFEALMKSLPNLPPNYKQAADFDWALHPGGSTILTGVERRLGLTPEHMRGSYDIYMNHGNSSSATIFSVLSRFRDKDMDECAPGGKVKDFVVACAFGPGVTIETCMLKRNLNHVARPLLNIGEITPPETESEGGRSETEDFDTEIIQSSILEKIDILEAEDKSLLASDAIIEEAVDKTLEAAETDMCTGSAAKVQVVTCSPPATSCQEDSFIMDVLNGVELD